MRQGKNYFQPCLYEVNNFIQSFIDHAIIFLSDFKRYIHKTMHIKELIYMVSYHCYLQIAEYLPKNSVAPVDSLIHIMQLISY